MFHVIMNFVSLFVTLKKVGGLYHWRIGRLGGSVYFKTATRKQRGSKVLAKLVSLTETSVKQTVMPVLDGYASEARRAFALSTIRHG